MRSPAHPVLWSDRAWTKAGRSVIERNEAGEFPILGDATDKALARRQTDRNGLATPLRIVGILAFCQALAFVIFFLFLCARAGAAPETKPKSSLELSPSVYLPQNTRDPFGSEALKTADGTVAVARLAGPDTLKLQGILYNKANPSALINDQLVELNKTAKVHTEQGDVEVKAVQITRELVLLDVGGQKIELRLGGNERKPADK